MTFGLRRLEVLPERIRLRVDVRYIGAVVAVAAVYFGAALAGNALRFTGNVDAVWPPAGVGIAALYLFGMRLWPGVLIGDLLADSPHHLPLISSVGQTAGNMAEAVVTVALLNRVLGRRSPFSRLEDLARFTGIVLLGTAISATMGCISLRAGGVISFHAIPRVWRTWWLGDSCGALLIVPFAIAWLRPQRTDATRRRPYEVAACAITLLILSELALSTSHPLIYLVFPGIVWATVRFGPRGGTLAVLASAVLAISETARSNGAFAVHSISMETLSIQLYIAAAIATTLTLTAMMVERRAFARTLAESRSRLIESAEIERSQLERNLHDGAQQRLSALAIRLRAAGSTAADEGATSFMLHAGQELERAIDELRELARGIHPTLLSRFGLATALESVAARSTLEVAIDLDLPEARLEPSLETTAYYLVAEALANTQRHSHATRASIQVSVVEHVLFAAVADNGIGNALERPNSGLRGLRDRVEGVGGSFWVTSPAGGGTIVSARIPFLG